MVALVNPLTDALARNEDDPVELPFLHLALRVTIPCPSLKGTTCRSPSLNSITGGGRGKREFLVVRALNIDAGIGHHIRVLHDRLVDSSLDLRCGRLSGVTTASKKDAFKRERSGKGLFACPVILYQCQRTKRHRHNGVKTNGVRYYFLGKWENLERAEMPATVKIVRDRGGLRGRTQKLPMFLSK